MTDELLLEAFVKDRSHEAFVQLVSRHGGWVHGLARRLVRDAHAADDVAQAVFLLLARKAPGLSDGRRLGAWLVRTTHLTSMRHLRDERRRRRRESLAAVRPTAVVVSDESANRVAALDNAVARFGQRDRQLIALRYYRGLSLLEVGRAQGVSEDAARKRVWAAVKRLRADLRKVTSGTNAAALLGPMAALGELPTASRVQDIADKALRPESAAPRSVQLAQGVSRMLKLKRIALAIVLIGSLCLTLTVGAAMQDYPEPKAAATLPSPATGKASPYREEELTRTFYTDQLVLRTTADGTQLNAYSLPTGAVALAPTRGRVDADKLIINSNVAAYMDDAAVLAFSSHRGAWAALPLPAGAKASIPIVGKEFVMVNVNGHLHVFSDASGKWSDPMP